MQRFFPLRRLVLVLTRDCFTTLVVSDKKIKLLSVTFVTMMSFVLTDAIAVGIIFLVSGERLKTG